jgi:5'-nucleotidase
MQYIIVDMDDTTAMYTQAYKRSLLLNPAIPFPQSQCGFFTELRPMPNAVYFLKALLAQYQCDIQIVTRPSTKNPMSYTEKVLWVKRYFGQDWVERLNFINDKTRYDADYIIDDKEWLGHPGEWIKFDGTDNRELTEWRRIYIELSKKLTRRK